ncbi:unnamed protein product [Polarella glacialis]|nr:unnamed protein product [Polarella glacialis]
MDALGSFADGQEFLGRKGVPEKLALELNDPNCDASVRVCLTRVLAAILRRTPAAAAVLLPTQQASFPQSVAMLLDSRDHAEKLCALNSWADASTSLEGLTFFLRWAPLVQEILDLVASTQNEVSKGAMGCWATVLQDRAPPGAIAEVGPESELWDIAVTRLLPMVLQNLKAKPFADVRAHTWGLLSILIRSRRSAQQTLPAQELRDLLLDFHSESASPARIAKHEFVKALVRDHAQLLGNFLDAEVDTLLQEYAKQGPHWVPRAAAVQVGDQAA